MTAMHLQHGHRSPKSAEEVVILNLPAYDETLPTPMSLGPRVNIFGKILESDQTKEEQSFMRWLDSIEDESQLQDKLLVSTTAVSSKPRRKVKEFEANLLRGRDKILGLIITPDFGPNFLYIEDIWENSVVSEWNDAHGPDMQVQVGDIITSVNGISSRAQDMLRSIRNMPIDASIRLYIEDMRNYESYGVTRTWMR